MKVSAQYAEEHFADIVNAASNGEVVEIALPGKPAVKLALVAGKSAASAPVEFDSPAVWLTPERPRSELFNSAKGKISFSDDWDSPETNEEIARLFNDGQLFPDEP